jgi:hypothetical protein
MITRAVRKLQLKRKRNVIAKRLLDRGGPFQSKVKPNKKKLKRKNFTPIEELIDE